MPDPIQQTVGTRTEATHGVPARAANFRDLGGLPTSGGGQIRHGVLYRSDASYSGDDPPESVSHWPPSAVVDLRSADEQRLPFVWPRSTSVHNVAMLSALAPALSTLAAPRGDADLYLQILRQSAAQLVDIVKLVAGAPGPVLLHCTMGRDRTGVVVAVVLLACDVGGASILADYEATRPNLRSVLSRLRAAGMSVPPDQDLPAHTFAVNGAAIEAVVDRLAGEPGGVVAWLGRHGASDSDLEQLRHKLVR